MTRTATFLLTPPEQHVATTLATVSTRLNTAMKALEHIAYEPLGHAEASPKEMLDIATNIAREALAALAKAEGGAR
jgi:hypothetical protein